ncbi:DNA/RNA non-specific endonuclease [Clostridium neonatale]|uniref:DNA/RNA non-specific endonuclease n=1 Tax=Clostridium neonatale TaxID=137838 RepID=UPI00291B6158|nr:Beta-lactamase [Clostridium neonatale]
MKWYQKTWGIILMLYLFFPVGLYLMWKHSKWNSKVKKIVTGVFAALCVVAIINGNSTNNQVQKNDSSNKVAITSQEVANKELKDSDSEKSTSKEEIKESTDNKDNTTKENKETVNAIETTSSNKDIFAGYTLIEVDGGNLSGHREPNAVVDIGFGDREYYAFTNEYGQLVKVIAKQIILQDDKTEPITSSGRYYSDEAKVPGTERSDLDEGHVIADSLGGVSNAYNITPQNSTLNRHGDQAYMEKVIRDAGGCTDFTAIITYPDTTTQIPSHYSYTYTIKGNVVNDEFDNINPDEYNANLEKNTASNNATSSNTGTTTNEAAQGDKIVYWTSGGKSYHYSKSCRTLSRSKNILEGPGSECPKTDPCDVCAK